MGVERAAEALGAAVGAGQLWGLEGEEGGAPPFWEVCLCGQVAYWTRPWAAVFSAETSAWAMLPWRRVTWRYHWRQVGDVPLCLGTRSQTAEEYWMLAEAAT